MRRAGYAVRRGIAAAVLASALAATLAGCGEPFAEPGADRDWAEFGPFEKPAKFAGEPGLPGPTDILVPEVGVVRLDAEDLLPEEHIESEFYTTTYDEHTPIVVGVVQTREVVHYRRHSETLFLTRVLGVSAEREPRVLTNFVVHKGARHTVALGAGSELGVVALLLEGELVEGEPDGRTLIGVDAARGTDVWRRNGGFPVYGEERALLLIAPGRDACAEKIVEYDVASGETERESTAEQYAAETGEHCVTA